MAMSWQPHDQHRHETSITITGLERGATYNVTVTATNAIGTSTLSAVKTVSLPNTPVAPTISDITGGDQAS